MTTMANLCARWTRFRPEVRDRTIYEACPDGISEAIQLMKRRLSDAIGSGTPRLYRP
jgi:hypothetical protein